MRAVAIRRGASGAELVDRVLCHDVHGGRGENVFRKGHRLRDADVPLLLATPWEELHVLALEPGDVGQQDAGRRLAESLVSAETECARSGHRHVLKARRSGLLEIDAVALTRLNSISGIAVFTLHDGQLVSAGQVVVEAQITPLAIEGSAIAAAEQIARQNIVRVLPVRPREVVFWTRDRRMVPAVTEKLRALGCTIREVVELSADAPSIQASMELRSGEARTHGTGSPPLFLVSGANALDPLDPIFVALRGLGATMQRAGIPVHPGTLLWIAVLGDITIIGLPSCGLGPQVTGFDLVLPKVLAAGRIRDEDLAALGHGGILTFARNRLREEDLVDETVR